MARNARSAIGQDGGGRAAALALGCAAIALASTSCTPQLHVHGAQRIDRLNVPSPTAPADADFEAAMLASPAETEPLPTTAFHGRTALDRLRSLDCLAQAVYYEAQSESVDGQRAVAQVVLNRVRHPNWPNSVCGVVYQGPMKAGGGCQFTFACDGSLAIRPHGPAWQRARSIAAGALAGATYAPVGLSTHYHTHEVAPHWAPALARTIEIGAHRFYRLPGAAGTAAAFQASYSGSEPLPVPPPLFIAKPGKAAASAALPAWMTPPAARHAHAQPAQASAAEADLAQPSTVREKYRHSGQWRPDAPPAITGRR